MTRLSWVAPQAWLSFTELDKAVVLVWLDWLVFCDYGFSVSALWCPLATLTILLGFLLYMGYLFRLLQQSTATAPYLGRGLSPHRCPSWPWMWNCSSRPSCICAATSPWTCGCLDIFITIFSAQTFFHFIYFKKPIFFIEVKQINNNVIVSGEERGDSATRIHVSNVPQFPLLCYTN